MSRRTRRPRGAPLHHRPDAVRYAREQAGLTSREVARRVGISESLMSDIAQGRRSAAPETLERIARVLGCPLSVLEAVPQSEGAS
ncbi:helix-turn-helix domain-containing protein [Streptomyces albidoflavus]|uniref:helix-turn-helix domain-containing protein n=1 Tax=Streptomyces TaxID=1883 RepID=UPI000C2A8C06|nr:MULTISPECIES: helix-turn-helix transcriptional regulator [unclassified Streptomyces]PKA32873.1 XRE family transcriptional regulator [Streptomyces sp. SM8]WPR52773.1 helix-turn-helix transcriptional regulator [Streptomyces sp. S399]